MIIKHITYDVCHGRCKQNVLAIVLHTVLEARHKISLRHVFSMGTTSLQVVYASAQWTSRAWHPGVNCVGNLWFKCIFNILLVNLLNEQRVWKHGICRYFVIRNSLPFSAVFPFHMLALSCLRIPRCKSSFFQHWTRQCWPLTPVSQVSKSCVKTAIKIKIQMSIHGLHCSIYHCNVYSAKCNARNWSMFSA